MTYVAYKRHSEGYGEITLQRPQKHNAINGAMITELAACLEQAKEDTISFLVITGAGNDTFCAGGDLHYFHGEMDSEHAFSLLYPMKEILHTILLFPVPTICLLNGNAFGGGCELATACDIRIAKANTRFGFIQSTLGIVPGWGGGTLLYEKVHTSFAFQWMTEGAIYSVEKLYDKGWIHTIVSPEDFTNHNVILKPYIRRTIDQMGILKSQYKQQILALSLSARMNDEVRHCASLWNSTTHQKAVEQFLRK